MTNPDGFPDDQEYILNITKRELEILRHFNMNKIIDIQRHVQDITLLYKENLKLETQISYASYAAELTILENKMLKLMQKINGVKEVK